MNKTQAYVTRSDDNFIEIEIEIEILDNCIKEKISEIGFINKTHTKKYRKITKTDEDKAEVFNQLRNLGVYFSNGREWCPAEIFEHLRDKGLLTGKYSMISWAAPEKYFLTTDK